MLRERSLRSSSVPVHTWGRIWGTLFPIHVRKKLKSRSKISGQIKQAAAPAGLPPASNAKRESRKRKAEENTTDIAQPEATIDNRRLEKEDTALDDFEYRWTPGYWGPRERGGEVDRSE